MKKILLSSALILCINIASYANTYTVNSTANSGTGSLRQAISDANAHSGADSIKFNISGIAPHTILLSTALPTLSGNLVIDGTTQSANGYAGPGPKVIIDGRVGGTSDNGLDIGGPYCSVYGLQIQNFGYNGIDIYTTGNYFVIGAAGKGNVICNNGYCGISVYKADNGIIKGNKIGTDSTGTAARPNDYNGIELSFGNNNIVIGGTANGEGNLISANDYVGIDIGVNWSSDTSSFVQIVGNKIGTDISGVYALGNDYDGISITGHTRNIIIEKNIVAFNDYQGISVGDDLSVEVTISRNSIFCNVSDGINLNGGWVGIGNGNIQAPVINYAGVTGISGTAPANSLVELFYDDSCSLCQGKTYIATVTANASGNWTYTAGAGGVEMGNVTATATSPLGTSEFAACVSTLTGINEYEAIHFSVYPNPGNGAYIMETENNCTVNVYDVIGSNIFNAVLQAGKHNIDISTYANGVYFVKVQAEGQGQTLKIVKQ